MARLQGHWRLEGISGGQAAIFLSVLDSDGRRIKPSRSVKFWSLAERDGEQGWSEIDVKLPLPEEATDYRLCLNVPAASGTAWFQDLVVTTE